MATPQFAGPVDYVVFAFDRGSDLSEGLNALLRQVNDSVIEILDLELITRDPATGRAAKGTLAALAAPSDLDLAVFDGADSGILDEEDLETIAADLGDDQFALAICYEDRSLAAAAAAWTRSGGVELLAGGIAIEDLQHALDEGPSS